MKRFLACIGVSLLAIPAFSADPAEREFFERSIRPVLVERCYHCHNTAKAQKGGLALDSREALRRGGASGPALLQGDDASASLLLQALRHDRDDLRMPKDGPKLDAEVIANFERWVKLGAPDPRVEAPSLESLEKSTSWEAVRERRKSWWSFRPIQRPEIPKVENDAWSRHTVDQFVFARMANAGLTPSKSASKRILARRLSFVLTGLPPSEEDLELYLSDDAAGDYERFVDRLLASERFGEKWARHFMDWFRYADSHGSEGDPNIPYAWRYRDYLIRALNEDVPYKQLVLEHVAGDQVYPARVNEKLGLNESALGVGHFRFVQHGYAPTDALDEQVRFTDNQIDVVSKAFLGVTISCARCHDHKFDPISQADYYALYGVFTSSRPAVITVDSKEKQDRNKRELKDLKARIRAALATAWARDSNQFADLIGEVRSGKATEAKKGRKRGSPKAGLQAAFDDAIKNATSPLHPWARVSSVAGTKFRRVWSELLDEWATSVLSLRERREDPEATRWAADSEQDFSSWHRHGSGIGPASKAGEFMILPDGDRIVANVYPSGVFSHSLSTKHSGLLTSPRFFIESERVYLRVFGGDRSRMRYSMQHYPRVAGPVYKGQNLRGDSFAWASFNTKYWIGDHSYLELATGADIPVEAKTGQQRSWFGISEVYIPGKGSPAPKEEPADYTTAFFRIARAKTPKSSADVAKLYQAALRASIDALNQNPATH
ncbi:MAG: DUF1549 domain-containing protein [Planctomycetota bacterium]